MTHDQWLEAPYQKMYDRAAELECPECGAQMEEDKYYKSVDCPECDYGYGVDHDIKDD